MINVITDYSTLPFPFSDPLYPPLQSKAWIIVFISMPNTAFISFL